MRDEVVFAHICFEGLYRFGAACGEKVKSENGGGRSCDVEKDEDDPGSQAGKFYLPKAIGTEGYKVKMSQRKINNQ
jgi:hypothetical protein